MLAEYIRAKPLNQCSYAVAEPLLLADAFQCHCISIKSALFKQQYRQKHCCIAWPTCVTLLPLPVLCSIAISRPLTSVYACRIARTTTDDYLHDLLKKSEDRALEAEGQTRHYSQRVRTLEWQKFQDKQSDSGLAQKYDSLTALLSCIRQEKKQVEERLHDTFTHVSSLKEKAARAKQSHAAELSAVSTNLELRKKVRLLTMNACHVLCLIACAVLRMSHGKDA